MNGGSDAVRVQPVSFGQRVGGVIVNADGE